jgi:hypothetical protein
MVKKEKTKEEKVYILPQTTTQFVMSPKLKIVALSIPVATATAIFPGNTAFHPDSYYDHYYSRWHCFHHQITIPGT